MNFLGSVIPDAELETVGNHLFQLCNGKAAQYIDAFAELLRQPATFELHSQPAVQHESEHEAHRGFVSPLVSLAVCLTLHHAANFHRRVLEKVTQFPDKLALLASTHFRTPCLIRQGGLVHECAGRGGWGSLGSFFLPLF